MRIPPFERFYDAHRDEILAHLVRRLGRDRAEDAFQETFLRALRAYPKLRHGGHLRAWIFTIANRVAIDAWPRMWQGAEIEDLETVDERPTYAELDDMTTGLPPKERAAVILRYGYDLPYAEIGTALGSSADAARQAASAGVRRLRRRRTQ